MSPLWTYLEASRCQTTASLSELQVRILTLFRLRLTEIAARVGWDHSQVSRWIDDFVQDGQLSESHKAAASHAVEGWIAEFDEIGQMSESVKAAGIRIL